MKTNQVLVSILVVMFAAGCSSQKEKVELPKVEAPAPAPELAKAEKSPAAPSATTVATRFSGSVEVYRTSDVATNVSGLIREVWVEEGQVVREGDALVDIDPADARLRLQAAEAGLNRVKAQVAMLTTQFERAKKLSERQAITDSDFDAISGQLAVARAGVAEAEVAVSMARKMVGDSKVRAPFDAVVTKVNAAKGEFGAAGPSPLVVLTEVGRVRARIQVPERYMALVKEGDRVKVRAPSTQGVYEGVVERINPAVQPGSRSFALLVKVESPDHRLLPGMFVEAELSGQGAQP